MKIEGSLQIPKNAANLSLLLRCLHRYHADRKLDKVEELIEIMLFLHSKQKKQFERAHIAIIQRICKALNPDLRLSLRAGQRRLKDKAALLYFRFATNAPAHASTFIAPRNTDLPLEITLAADCLPLITDILHFYSELNNWAVLSQITESLKKLTTHEQLEALLKRLDTPLGRHEIGDFCKQLTVIKQKTNPLALVTNDQRMAIFHSQIVKLLGFFNQLNDKMTKRGPVLPSSRSSSPETCFKGTPYYKGTPLKPFTLMNLDDYKPKPRPGLVSAAGSRVDLMADCHGRSSVVSSPSRPN